MNAEISKGMSAQAAIEKYASDLTGDKRKDAYYLKRMSRTFAQKLSSALGEEVQLEVEPNIRPVVFP